MRALVVSQTLYNDKQVLSKVILMEIVHTAEIHMRA